MGLTTVYSGLVFLKKLITPAKGPAGLKMILSDTDYIIEKKKPSFITVFANFQPK